MKTKNFFSFENAALHIGIVLPKEITEQPLEDFLQLNKEAEKSVPKEHIYNLKEGQTAILSILTTDCGKHKEGLLLAEEYAKILKQKVIPALRAALYMYKYGEGDRDEEKCLQYREKCAQRTRTLCAFALGYIEARAIFDRQIGELNLKEEVANMFSTFEEFHIPFNLEGGFFRKTSEAMAYMTRE
jgi:hypothetical protein